MYMHHTLSRSFDEQPHTSFSITDDDAINAAHMLAVGFNTMNRNTMGDFVMGVVDTKTGTVQYDGKTEKLDRCEPGVFNTTMKLHAATATDPDAFKIVFGDAGTGGTTTMYAKSVDLTRADNSSRYAHINREVLEDAYHDMQAVVELLGFIGVETIPPPQGVRDLAEMIRRRDAEIAELTQQRANANAEARAEMISFVKRAHAKKARLTRDDVRPDLEDRWRGMLDVLAKFLVVTGEADADEGHAVARRLCGIDEEMP